MRPIWSGSISFGLVNIPVGLYPATRHKSKVDLVLLRDSDQSRIHYKKVAEADGKEVKREHIVKGYEYAKGEYVVITDEDFRSVEIKSNQTVDIREFVNLSEVEPRYFNESYFLVPQKAGAKVYALLRNALERTGLAGIAKVVIRPPREHLAIVKPLDDVLVLETLHFTDELLSSDDIRPMKAEVGEKELKMALSFVKTLEEKWHPEKYHDEYRESLMKLIDAKVKSGGKQATKPRAHLKHASSKIIDLAALLQQSLDRTKASEKQPKAKKSSRSRASHRKAA